MENEIQDIIRQMRALTARLEALLPAEEAEVASAMEEEIAEEAEAPAPAKYPINFTLNDRYRFMRELFNNSADDMLRMVTDLEALTTKNDAIDYIQALGWDMEDPIVKDFTDAVTERFNPSHTLIK